MGPHPAQNRRNSNRKERADAGFEDPPEIVGFSFQQNNIDDETSKSDDEVSKREFWSGTVCKGQRGGTIYESEIGRKGDYGMVDV